MNQSAKVIGITGVQNCEDVSTCVVSHLLCDLNSPDCNAPEIEITLENLYEMQENPTMSRNVMRLDSVDTLMSEMNKCSQLSQQLMGNAKALFVDMTSAEQKRNCAGLFELQNVLPNVTVIAATGPDLKLVESGSIDSAAHNMIIDLIHGMDCVTSTGDNIKTFAGIVTVSIDSLTTGYCMRALDACLLLQTKIQSNFQVLQPPPLFIRLGKLENDFYTSILDYLESKASILSTIVLCCNVLSLSRLSYFENMLSKYPSFLLLVDCFGHVEKGNFVHNNNDNLTHPCDEEVCAVIRQLISKGFSDRLILTASVNSKLNLLSCGGAGYSHILKSVIPRLRKSDIRMDIIRRITVTNMISLMKWYVPPEVKPIAREGFQCFVCGKSTEYGDHYEKFEFLYCTSTCLREHAKKKWAK